MTNKVDKPESGQRKVTVRELVESELDLIVGGATKETEKKKCDKDKTAADHLTIQLTNVQVTS